MQDWGDAYGAGQGIDGALRRILTATVNDAELAALFVRVGCTTRALKGTSMLRCALLCPVVVALSSWYGMRRDHVGCGGSGA